MTPSTRRAVTAIALVLVALGALALGKTLSTRTNSPEQPRVSAHAPLQVIERDLAVVHPNRCEEFKTEGGVSVRVPGKLVENLGDQAMIISTEFRVFVGEREYQSFQDWRVPVGEQIRDVALLDESNRVAHQMIVPGISRCMLFVERKGTYLPAFKGPPPHGAGAQVGVRYPYTWHTHCGATILMFDGRWWKPSPPLSSDPHNPPPGWDDNDERGGIVLLARERARFTARRGQIASLVPTTTPKEDPVAGCE